MQSKVSSALTERRINKTEDTDIQSLFDLAGTPSSAKIVSIPISQLTDYPNQPFKPFTEERLAELAESIKEHGLLNPVRVRYLSDEQYQILAGHNRKNACVLLGWEEIDTIIEVCNDDTAEMIMLTSNICQRPGLLHSEKAFAYKRQMDILRRQGKRTDLEQEDSSTQLAWNSPQPAWKRESAQIIANQTETSRDDIRRYIRLTFLLPELLDAVDDGAVPFMAGVNLSYLCEENQKTILSWLVLNGNSISIKKSEQICQKAKKQELTLETLLGVTAPIPRQTTQPQTFSVNRKKWKAYDDLLPKDNVGFEKLFKQFLEWLRVQRVT